jgi:multidrug efflux pump subunit AcrA (membrane-fusion protein)
MSTIKKLTFFIPSLFLLLLAGCSGTNTAGTPTPGSQAATPVLADNTVSASGEVVPQKWVNLSFASGGQGLKILIEPGQSVSEGILLASVNDLSAIAARDAASAQLANANAQLASANAQVASANAQLASAKANLNRLELALYAQPDLDSGKAAVTAGEEAVSASKEAVSAAEAGITAAQSNLDVSNQALENTKLYSPFNGLIVQVNGHDGEIASPGQPLIIMADLSTLQVQTTDMSEVDAMQVQAGDTANVSFDALPNVNVTGKVLKIALEKSPGSGVYYTVTISLDTIPENLRWGMSAFVVISTKK